MFPIIFSIGSISITSMSVAFIFSLFLSSFIFWRKGREENFELVKLFDGFLLSSFFGFLASRLAYIIFNFNHFGFNLLNWFDLTHYPGFNTIIGIVGATLYLHHFSLKQKWDSFEVLDFWVTSISIGLATNFVGLFLAGAGIGKPTSMPWGVVFPQLVDPHHPVQLYSALFYLILFFYLSKVEYDYRTFSWYRNGKKTAQTGFLTAIFLIAVAVFNFFMSFLRPTSFNFLVNDETSRLGLELLLYLFVFSVGLSLLLIRSGRTIPLLIKKKPRVIRTKLENIGE